MDKSSTFHVWGRVALESFFFWWFSDDFYDPTHCLFDSVFMANFETFTSDAMWATFEILLSGLKFNFCIGWRMRPLNIFVFVWLDSVADGIFYCSPFEFNTQETFLAFEKRMQLNCRRLTPLKCARKVICFRLKGIWQWRRHLSFWSSLTVSRATDNVISPSPSKLKIWPTSFLAPKAASSERIKIASIHF